MSALFSMGLDLSPIGLFPNHKPSGAFVPRWGGGPRPGGRGRHSLLSGARLWGDGFRCEPLRR